MSPGKLVLGVLPLGLALFLSSARAAEAQGFDFARYRPRPVQDLLQDYPAQRGLVITKDVPIRATVVYSGEFRDLSEGSQRLLGAWAEAFNVPVAPAAFRTELRVVEAGREYWVPVQEALVPAMKGELRPGEQIDDLHRPGRWPPCAPGQRLRPRGPAPRTEVMSLVGLPDLVLRVLRSSVALHTGTAREYHGM